MIVHFRCSSSGVDLFLIVPFPLQHCLTRKPQPSNKIIGISSAKTVAHPTPSRTTRLSPTPNDLGLRSGIHDAYPLPGRSEMASSLPFGVGGSKSAKPAKGRLSILTNNDPVKTPYGSEGTFSFRKRATTTNSATPESLLDRRSKIGSQLQTPLSVPHLGLKIQTDPSALFKTHDGPQTQPALNQSSIIDDCPSAPIAIPIPKPRPSRPTTPLTGRERSFFPHSPKELHTPPEHSNNKGFTPSPGSLSQSSQSEREQFAHSPISRRSMRSNPGGASPMYTPSSPLSPTMPVHPNPSVTQHNARRHSSNQHHIRQPAPLAMSSLPPYHPANYESHHPSPRASRPASSSHGRQLSDAQKKLQRHQRELVINATRTAAPSTTKPPVPRPSSPRLDPLSSPGPITPLMLEGQTDYFLGGPSTASTAGSKSSDRREMVERLIGVEKDRIRHPGTNEHHSPAVSPAA